MTNMTVCSLQQVLTNTATRYLTLTGSGSPTQNVYTAFPACTLKKFRVYVMASIATTDQVLTVRKNGVDTGLTITILVADAKPKLYSVSVDVAVAENDLLDISSVCGVGGTGSSTLTTSLDFL